jgi:hypothetical protein
MRSRENGMSKSKVSSMILFGITGALIGILIGGICMWSLSMSPEFFVMDIIIDLFLVPLGIAGLAGLLAVGFAYQYKGKYEEFYAFGFAFLGSFLSIWATPIMIYLLLSSSDNLVQSWDNFLHILVGIIFVGVLALFRLIAIRLFGTQQTK